MLLNGIPDPVRPLSRAPGRVAGGFRRAIRPALMCALGVAAALGGSPALAQNREEVRPVFEHALPNAEGKRIVAVLVTYPPGGKSLAHHHAPSAFVYAYVLSGSIRGQINNEPSRIYHAGESFYELPGSHHQISENASSNAGASLLAIFVVDSKDDPLTMRDQAATGSR